MNIISIDIGNHTTKIYTLYNSKLNIVEGSTKRYISTAISFDNKYKCRYYADDAITKIISCPNTLVNLTSKIFDYNKIFYFDKKRYSLTGQYIYIMFINHIFNHISKTISNTFQTIIPFPDYYTQGELNTLKVSYKYSNIKDPLYIPHSVAIGLEYGLYKSIKHTFTSEMPVLFIDIGHINISFYLIVFNNYSMTVERTWVLNNSGSDYLDKQLLNSVVHYITSQQNIFNSSDMSEIIDPSEAINEKVLKKILINMENIRKNLNMFDKTTLHIDNLFNDYDLNMEITKQDYLLLYKDVLTNYKNIIEIFYDNYNISHIELLGGFSRYNIFSDIISKLNKPPIIKKTLNAEETIAKGGCLYGSVISPIYKNMNYTIKYKYPYIIYIIIDNDKPIALKNEILPLNKDIIKRYETNKPRLGNKNISIQIYISDNDQLDQLKKLKPIYNIKHKASSLISKLSLNLIIELDMIVSIKSISYITTTHKKFNITWKEQQYNLKTYIRYNELLTKCDIEYKNKLKLINTFEEYIYNIDTVQKDKLNKINPTLFDDLNDWLMNDIYTLDYKECINQIEHYTNDIRNCLA